ncbi:MAG: recombination protein RecR [Bacteroidales bacterium]|nr:recombination protein RecR [Bacteroidales bacterium]
MQNYSSKLLEEAVNEFTRLPGIGRRSALRLALHLLRQDGSRSDALGNAIIKLRSDIRYCTRCHNISDDEVCGICSDLKRDGSIICVVEDIRDVMAIENTGQFRGMYHVLGGIISPMDGIGPNDLSIESLLGRTETEEIREVIMALPATTEGDTTNYYLFKKLKDRVATISAISRGVAIGDELEFADEITLGKSILNRILYEKLTE